MSPVSALTDGEAQRAVIEVADDIFYQQGVAATSMADIRDRSGVSLRRIYRLYPAKSDLVAGWLRHRHEAWTQWFVTDVERRLADGADPVEAVFDALGRWLSDTAFRGCGFINTLAEGTELTDEHREIIRHHKRSLVDTLARYGPDPAAMAVLVDGAIVRSSVEGSIAPVDDARRAAHALLATAQPS